MAFCKHCGFDTGENAAFCSSCGKAVGGDSTGNQTEHKNGFKEEGGAFDNMNDFLNTEDLTGNFSPTDIDRNKGMGIAAYIIFFLPLLAAKDSPYARFHANQGLVLLITSILVSIVDRILGLIPLIGWLISLVLGLAVFALFILGIVNAAGGKAKRLPLIGTFDLIK